MRWGRRAVMAGVGIAAVLGTESRASFVMSPGTGQRESALAGNTVAAPSDGSSILWQNPAGIADLAGTEATAGVGLFFAGGRYSNPDSGYDARTFEIPAAPTAWIASDGLAPWHVGAGLYGAVGSAFNFPGSPAAGVPNRFLGELSVIHLGLVAGREILPGLRIAAQAAPTYGAIRARTPSPIGPIAFDVDGFGITGAAGLLYDLGPATTIGVSYRSPGIVWMDGDGVVGPDPEEVEIAFRIPQAVRAGFAFSLTDRLTLVAQSRWTDYPEFEEGEFEFARNPMLDRPFIADARPTFRYGASLEYRMSEQGWLRAGAAREEWMMEGRSLSPLLYDNTDVILGFGAGVTAGAWTIDVAGGYAVIEDRVVTADENPSFPGRYQLEGGIAGISISYRWPRGG